MAVNTRTATEFADPETRGRMRAWKQKLDARYKIIDRLIKGPQTKQEAVEFCARSSRIGRQRIFERVKQRMQASGAVLWGLRLDGPDPLALWAVLRPRDAVSVGEEDPAYQQNCITVNYVLFGSLPDDLAGIGDGYWTIEVPDHALGRVMQRSTQPPDQIIMAAHQTLLRLRHSQVMPTGKADEQQFLIRSGPGGFVCTIRMADDISIPEAGKSVFTTARTWLSDDQLRDEQILLVEDGEVGDRLGDSWLMPALLRRGTYDKDSRTAPVRIWHPGLLDTIAAPMGRA